jgi:hypothetical protein
VVALVLSSVALAVSLIAVGLAVVVMRQNATTTRELRHHRTQHQRTHGRPDPDPEHHGTSPTVQRLCDELETLGGLYDDLHSHTGALTVWARDVDRRLPPRDDPAATQTMSAIDPTSAMPAARRPEVRP